MTDKEFAMEALGFIRDMVNSDEHYLLTETGSEHHDYFIKSVGPKIENKKRIHIMRDIIKIEPAIERIKAIANGGHLVGDKKYSESEIAFATLQQYLSNLDDFKAVAEDAINEWVEFNSIDDILSKLMGGKE